MELNKKEKIIVISTDRIFEKGLYNHCMVVLIMLNFSFDIHITNGTELKVDYSITNVRESLNTGTMTLR